MKALTTQEIKMKQLILLEVEGFCLRDFSNTSQSSVFISIQGFTDFPELQKIKTKRLKTVKKSPNSNLQAFAWVLLQTIYHKNTIQEVLYILKSTFLSDQLNKISLDGLRGSLIAKLSQQQMKKFMVQFLFQVSYCSLENKVEYKLNKYPVLLDIMSYFFRKILASYEVENSEHYNEPVSSLQAYRYLIDYFDLNCTNKGKLFLFYEDNLFISSQQQVMFGWYSQHSEKKRYKTEEESENGEVDPWEEENKLNKGNLKNPHLIGMAESIIVEADADTPSFYMDQSQTSFRSSMASDTIGIPEYSDEGSPTSNMNESRMKVNDMKSSKMKQSMDIFGSCNITEKRKVLEKQLKQSLEKNYYFDKVIDTPDTASKTPIKIEPTLQYPFIPPPTINRLPITQQPIRKSKSLKFEETNHDCTCSAEESDEENDDDSFPGYQKPRICLNSNIFDISIWVYGKAKDEYGLTIWQAQVASKGLTAQYYFKNQSNSASSVSSQKLFSLARPLTCSPIKFNSAPSPKFSFTKKSLSSKFPLLGQRISFCPQ